MKRFAKIFLAALLVLLAAVAGLTIYVKVKYPAERLRQLLISHAAEEYRLRVAIARLDFNLFRGFELDDVVLHGATTDSASQFEAPPLTVEKIKLAYRWRSLLSRRLDVDEMIIEHPSFFYRLDPDNSSNFDAIFAAVADSATAASDTAAAGLPISIRLQTLHLKNLHISAVLASAVDSQRIAFGPINLTVNEMAVSRQAQVNGKVQWRAESAAVRYRKTPIGEGVALMFAANLHARLSSAIRGDSLAVQGEMALDNAQIKLGNGNNFSLPRLATKAEIRHDFASSRLEAPEITLLLDGKEQLAARFEMSLQNGAPAFALRVNRGVLDLANLLTLARAHTSGEMRVFLQNIDCAGEVEFSGSTLESDAHGMTHQIILQGRNLAYADQAAGLKFNEGNFTANWKTNADSSAEAEGKFHFGSFDFPLDTAQALKTGPVDLQLNFALAKDFMPLQGGLDLSWQNFSEGEIQARAVIGPVGAAPRTGSWLSRLSGNVEIKLEALEISPFAANVASGKISGKLTLAGKRLDEADLHVDLRNEKIRYETIEYKGRAPDYHLTASSRLMINSALTKFSLPSGKLQFEPAQASFSAIYDAQADTFRFNLPNFVVDLSQVRRALPDTILASMNYAKLTGSGKGSGWLQGRFFEPDSLDYRGVFALHSTDAAYVDSVLGIYTDSLQINSEWILTAAKTTGIYAVACSTPRLPDYLRKPLPPTTATGRLTVDEATFTITDGKLEIPHWHAVGNYRVDGEFRPAGVQVKTTVDLGLRAPKAINIDRGMTLRGDLQGQLIINQYIPNALTAPQPFHLNGWLRADGMNIQVDTTLALYNLKADCRFNQDFDLLYVPLDSTAPGMKLEPEGEWQPFLVLKSAEQTPHFAHADEALLMYELFRDNAGERSRVTIEKIEVLGYQLSNLAADLHLGNSRFDIPKFSVNLFDGNVAGNLLVGLGSGNPDSISYATNMQIASIDVSGFRRLSAELGGKQSRVSANFALHGLGIPQSGKNLETIVNNLTGRLNITKIENKVASNLLQALDPKGTDKGIQNMRLLMKTRWNVRQLAFEMKNGFVYASLTHVKPWYAPFTLPQPLDFARFPVKPYLKTASTE
ncbi:MAG: hypothetical protein ONB46_11000 [candidate division KSB1 bacterium]|nr:hypothetical protein [candidate division KSB1 bacterium]MDZ7366384.1 hypothetical protein [candidate division KSB1 bacterium]MDZ7404039.1 hypothetical protein [candidate division KSB1 bacterium]